MTQGPVAPGQKNLVGSRKLPRIQIKAPAVLAHE